MLDLILRNCVVIDGASDTTYPADIGVLGDAIVKIGDLREFSAVTEIDCEGRYASPGFIDAHSHSDLNPFIENGFESKIRQGVTTEVIGNCGYSVYPLAGEFQEKVKKEAESLGVTVTWRTFAEYAAEVEKRGALSLNLVPLVGLSAARAFHAGYVARNLTNAELSAVRSTVAESLDAGAAGVSTGMIYPPCCYFETGELVSIISAAAERGRVFATHMRSEGDGLLEAIGETLDIARKTRVSTQISHLKTAERHNWHKIDAAFEAIEDAIRDGISVTADRYPYLASQTSLDMTLPKWVFDGGDAQAMRRLSDPLASARVKSELLKKHPDSSDYWEGVVVSETNHQPYSRFEGLNFRQIFNEFRTMRPDCQKFDIADCLFEFLVKEKMRTSAIFFNMCEKNLDRILLKPYVMVGSDATARSVTGPLSRGKPHPRAFSSFVKYLTDMVSKKRAMTLAQAVARITSLPAQKFGLAGRGRIAPTFYADITIFDQNGLVDRGDFINPARYPDGIEYVIVNGSVVYSRTRQFIRSHPGRMLLAPVARPPREAS